MPLAPPASLVSIGWSQEEKKLKPKTATKKRKGNRSVTGYGKKAKRRKKSIGDGESLTNAGTKQSLPLEQGNVSISVEGRVLTLDDSGDQHHTPCIEGHALIQVLSGNVNVMGFELTMGSQATLNFPSWSNSVPIRVSGNAVVNVRSRSEERKATVTPLVSAPRPITISESWQSACDAVLGNDDKRMRISSVPNQASAESSRILICGAKSTGKSTLLRYLVNRHLSRGEAVIVLDCDVGQPELSPPGLLTLTLVEDPLLSLPHVHMKRAHLKAHFYGHVTSRNDPTTYLGMISDLLEVYRQYIENHQGQKEIPLVVNTDGWVKGFGFEVLSTIIERVRPTHVVQLTGNSPAKAFTVEALLPSQSTLVCAEAFESQSQADIPPQALRSLRLSTYFFDDATIWDRLDFGPMGIVDHDCEIANTLASRKPYVVAVNSVRCEVPFAVSPAAVLDLLNGSIVGLGVDVVGEIYPSCIGLGIVRSIDRERMIMYILSPVPQDKIANVSVLLNGTLELPVECVFRGVHAEAHPYIACSRKVDGIGGEIMKSRQNIGRKSLTKIR